jgi:iron complex outermembrane receptor protein
MIHTRTFRLWPDATPALVLSAMASLGIAALPVPAQAQAPQQTAPLTITAPAPSLTVPSIDDARDQIQRIPGGAEVVPAEQFRDTRAAAVKDMLDFVPGVFTQSKYGQEDSRLSIRGSGLSNNNHLRGLLLLQDGMPFNSADGFGDFQEVDPLVFRHVEVYKGANALQYGSSYLGGAVNFVSPTGRSWPGYLARFDGGSFGSVRGQVAAGDAAGGWDYFISPTWSKSEGFRDHSEQDYTRLNTNLGYRFGPKTETRFFFQYNNIDQDIPTGVTKSQALSAPQTTQASSFLRDTQRDIDSVRIGNKTTLLIDDFEATVGAYYRDRILYHPLAFGIIDDRSKEYMLFGRVQREGSLFGHKDRFLVGANLFGGNTKHQIFGALTNGITGAKNTHSDQRALTVDLYAENQFFAVPTVALVAGVQGSYADRVDKDRFLTNGDDSGSVTYHTLSPKFGILWDVWPKLQVFGNYSWSAEPPNFSALNPTATAGFFPLKVQKAQTLELGTRGQAGDWAWDVSLYNAWLRNEMQLITFNDGTTQTLNVPRTIHRGIEAGVDGVVLRDLLAGAPGSSDRLKLRAAYALNDFRFDDNDRYGDNRLPVIPIHYLRAELRYDHPSGFYAGPNVEWVPSPPFVDNANTVQSIPYALLGFKAGWDFGNGLKLFLDGRNLLDKTYIADVTATPTASAASTNFNPGIGQAVYAGFEFRW